MGLQVNSGVPYRPSSVNQPQDPHTESKLCAEQGRFDMSNASSMAVIIIRSPVVYGLNASVSIGALSKAIKLGLPLPLRGVHSGRHLIFMANLADLIIKCIAGTASTNKIFIASDGETISTSDLFN